jgi:hypothetical protein
VKVALVVSIHWTTADVDLGSPETWCKAIEMPVSPAGLQTIAASVAPSSEIHVRVETVTWDERRSTFYVRGVSHADDAIRRIVQRDSTWEALHE